MCGGREERDRSTNTPCVDALQQARAADVMFCTRVCESLSKLGFCSKRKKKSTEQRYFAYASLAKFALHCCSFLCSRLSLLSLVGSLIFFLNLNSP